MCIRDRDDVKNCRESEAKAAAEYMGVTEIRFFDYGDYPLFMDECRIRRLTSDILALSLIHISGIGNQPSSGQLHIGLIYNLFQFL